MTRAATLARRCLDPSEIIGSDVVIRPAGGRSASVVLTANGRPTGVIKPVDARARRSEVAARAVLDALPHGTVHVPEVRASGADALVVQWVEGRTFEPGAAGPALLAELGQVLRRVHGLRAGTDDRPPPWATRLHHPTPSRLAWTSAAIVSLIRGIQADGPLADALDAMAGLWSAGTFTHGDLRLENVIVRQRAPHIALIDWENSGSGDPLEDAGGVVGDLLGGWARRMDPFERTDAAMLRTTRDGLDAVLRQIAAFWSGYGATGIDLRSAVRWGGVRLVQRAAELCQHELFPDPVSRAYLLAARVALTQPDDLAAAIARSA